MIYSSDLFTYNAKYFQTLPREKWRSFANSLRSMLKLVHEVAWQFAKKLVHEVVWHGMGQFGAAISAMDVSAMKCEMHFPLECHQSAKVRTAVVKRVGARFVPIVQK